MPLDGACLCGAIRFEVSCVPDIMGVCHCRQCQKQSGSAFSTMASVPRHSFRLVRGRPKRYSHRRTASGDLADLSFCGRCGSPLHTALASQPGVLFLKTGTLEDTSWFEPQFHVWCADKQAWVVIDAANRPAPGEPAPSESARS